MRIMAWPGGAQILTEKSRLNVKAGFDSASRTLKLLAVSPDTMSSTTRTTKKGARVRGTFHASDNTDLAVLKAEVPSPVRCFDLLLRPEGVEALDPVMVMGFPTGTRILEDRRANHSPSVGVVRKVEDTIFIDAAIVGGNSGGPVVNTGGQVIGMATRVFGSASLGSCIRPKYLQALFPGASYFLARAKAFAKAHPDAARQSLRLVEALGPTAGQSREVQAIKASLQR